MVGGAWPDARQLTNLVRVTSTLLAWSGEGHETASRRWLGRKPEGPGAEPLGKDLTALRTIDSGTVTGGGVGPDGRVGYPHCGCLFSISWRIVDEGLAKPFEVRALMALLYCPSWVANFALLMLVECWLIGCRLLEWDSAPITDSDQRFIQSPSSHLSIRDLTSLSISRQRRRKPVAGLANIHFDSMNSFVHRETSLGSSTTRERHSPRTLAHRSRAPLGTCCSVGIEVWRTSASEGKTESGLARALLCEVEAVGADKMDGADGADEMDGAGANEMDGMDGADGADEMDGADGADEMGGATGAEKTDGADRADEIVGTDEAEGKIAGAEDERVVC